MPSLPPYNFTLLDLHFSLESRCLSLEPAACDCLRLWDVVDLPEHWNSFHTYASCSLTHDSVMNLPLSFLSLPTTIMEPQLPDLCTVCNEPTTKRCNKCKSAQYCSSECQKADWPTHKLLCAAFAAFDNSTRPSPEHIRAILFPEDGEAIQVVWLDAPWVYGEYRSTQTDSFLAPKTCPYLIPIDYNPILKRPPPEMLMIVCRDLGGSRINKSIKKICATKSGWAYFPWEGPVLAYSRVGRGSDPPDCRDITMSDFRHITDYLLWYRATLIRNPQPSISEVVKGVRINCIGDQKTFDKPVFEQVTLSSKDPIFTSHDTSDIAARVGLPLYTRKLTPDPKWAQDTSNKMFEMYPFVNFNATYLHLSCDPDAEFDADKGVFGWGLAPSQYQNNTGSIVVVRQDKKPLNAFDMEAMCKYCREEVHPIFLHSIGEWAGLEPLSREATLGMISRIAFAIKWLKVRDQKREEYDFTDYPYPYNV